MGATGFDWVNRYTVVYILQATPLIWKRSFTKEINKFLYTVQV